MNLFWVFAFFVLSCDASHPVSHTSDRPELPDTFTVNIEGIFKKEDKTTNKINYLETRAVVFYDRPRNRAAINILYQGETTRGIYNYGDDQALSIQGSSCDVGNISIQNAFFPFDMDATTGKKTIASAEESLYFTQSEFDGEDTISGLPVLVYKATMDVPRYRKKACDIFHRFSKPDETMADCDMRSCKMTLYSITVKCDEEKESLNHVYNFYAFRSRITDESAFQIPNGVYCDGSSSKPLPKMPIFFCLDYSLTEDLSVNENNPDKSVEVSYRKACFDEEFMLFRVDNYEGNEIASTQTYDLNTGVGVALTPNLQQCDIGPTTDNLTPEEITFLPNTLFVPSDGNPVYTGVRQSNGLSFHVWSTSTDNAELQAVKDIYFMQKETTFQLSRAVVYYYEVDEDDSKTLAKLSSISIGKIITEPRDWSVFNISECFPDSKKMPFVIKLKPECFLKETPQKRCKDFNLKKDATVVRSTKELLYSKLVASSNVSILRMSGIEVASISENELTFRGIILDDPMSLTDTIQDEKPEASMSEAFSKLQRVVSSSSIKFLVYTDDKIVHMRATAFGKPAAPLEDLGGFTLGSMLGIAVIMTVFGLIVGALIFYVYQKSRAAQEARMGS